MEAAAKTVELLSQRILPQEPHHLSLSPDWRYRPSASKPGRVDVWHSNRLQYLTLVSDADRGVLLTRPDYEMREDIAKPPPRDVAALARSGAGAGAGEAKKKLSLSDYNKKKTTPTLGTSASPPEPSIAKRRDAERASGPADPAPRHRDDPRSQPPSTRTDGQRSLDRPGSGERRVSRPAGSPVDMRLPPKPPTVFPLPPKPPTPDRKKRGADHDDELRPQKRPRADAGRPSDERSHSYRDEPPRRDRDPHNARDESARRDRDSSGVRDAPRRDRDSSNARDPPRRDDDSSSKRHEPLRRDRDSSNARDPPRRDDDSSGARHEPPRRDRDSINSRDDPPRRGRESLNPRDEAHRRERDRDHANHHDESSKRDKDSLHPRGRIPAKEGRSVSNDRTLQNGRPLLKDSARPERQSPAAHARTGSTNGVRNTHVNESSRNTPNKTDPASKSYVPPLLSPLNLDINSEDDAPLKNTEKKRRAAEQDNDPKPYKHRKPEPAPPPPAASKKAPLRILPLLSPTLPPAIEAELNKRPTPPDTSEGKSPEVKAKDEKEQAALAKRGITDLYDDFESKSRAKTFIVTLWVRKRRAELRRILDEPPRKESAKTVGSQQDDTQSSSQQRKRASDSAELAPPPASDSIAVKRPRASEISASARLPAPSTPSKKSTAMSRVSSSNSHANTPGAGPAESTPAPRASAERAVNGRQDSPDMASLKDLDTKFISLGKRLKHVGQRMLHSPSGGEGSQAGSVNGTSARPRDAASTAKHAHLITLESVIAFMAGFHVQNRQRALQGKPASTGNWESLFPLIEHSRTEMRRCPALVALLLVLYAISLEETVRCYWTFRDPANHIGVADVAKHERAKLRVLGQLRDAMSAADAGGGSAFRVDVHPWSTVEEVVEACLRVMRKYAAEEKIDWRPEVSLKDLPKGGLA